MSNMSYCRFRNTEQDVEDCIEALNTEGSISSLEEKKSARSLITKVLDFCGEQGIIGQYSDTKLDKAIDECYLEEEEKNGDD